MRQQLESMMDSYQPMVSEQRQATYFVVGDLESLGVSALYTPKPGFIPLSEGGISIPYGNLNIPELKDLHDTFKVDRYGNLYGGHTTFDSKFHINTDPLKSGKIFLKNEIFSFGGFGK